MIEELEDLVSGGKEKTANLWTLPSSPLTKIIYTNGLLTEREVCAVKYQTEVF
jgi:hypothetical protein